MMDIEPQSTIETPNEIPIATKSKKNSAIGMAMLRTYYPVLDQLESVPSFRTLKSDILSAAQQLVLKYALSEKKMEKASFIQLVQGFEILNKCERLENNQSTENVNHHIFGKVDLK